MQPLQLVIPAFLVALHVFQVEGPNAEELADTQILNAVTSESLSETVAFKDGVDISVTFKRILDGLSREPRNGVIDYRIAIFFIDALSKIAPDTAMAMRTVCYVMDRNKDLPRGRSPVSMNTLVPEALHFFYGYDHVDQESMKKWVGIAPYIYKALEGNEDAPQKIVDFLEKRFKDFTSLRKIDTQGKREILQMVTKDIHKCAKWDQKNE